MAVQRDTSIFYNRCGSDHNSLPSGTSDKVSAGGFYFNDDEGGIVTQLYTQTSLQGTENDDGIVISNATGLRAISYAQNSDKKPYPVEFSGQMMITGFMDAKDNDGQSVPLSEWPDNTFDVEYGGEKWRFFTVDTLEEVEARHDKDFPVRLDAQTVRTRLTGAFALAQKVGGTTQYTCDFSATFDIKTDNPEFVDEHPCP